MMLYRFLSLNSGLRVLQEKRLRISRIDQLNDEFEFIGLALKTKAERVSLLEKRAHLGGKSGIICMSRRWSNPLLWGHYADNMRGMALGFEVEEARFHPVEYVASRPKLSDYGYHNLKDISSDDIRKLMLTKFEAWSYEEESRGFYVLNRGEIIGEQTHYFESFSNTLQLKTVVLGSRCPLSRAEISDALGSLADSIEAYKSRPAFQDFSIVRNKDENLWK